MKKRAIIELQRRIVLLLTKFLFSSVKWVLNQIQKQNDATALFVCLFVCLFCVDDDEEASSHATTTFTTTKKKKKNTVVVTAHLLIFQTFSSHLLCLEINIVKIDREDKMGFIFKVVSFIGGWFALGVLALAISAG